MPDSQFTWELLSFFKMSSYFYNFRINSLILKNINLLLKLKSSVTFKHSEHKRHLFKNSLTDQYFYANFRKNKKTERLIEYSTFLVGFTQITKNANESNLLKTHICSLIWPKTNELQKKSVVVEHALFSRRKGHTEIPRHHEIGQKSADYIKP